MDNVTVKKRMTVYMNMRDCCLLCLAFLTISCLNAQANDVVGYNGIPGSGRIQIYAHRACRGFKHLGGCCWEPFEMDLTKSDLDEAHRLGLKVVVWGWPEKEGTEFNYAQIEKLIDFGVDGFITDRPDILRGILVTKGWNLPNGFEIQGDLLRTHSKSN
jgi:Glycerophosphoryl diester phosphodiesterase family